MRIPVHLAVGASALALFCPALAVAQETTASEVASDAGDDAIVVTGSRIRRNPLDQDAPVTFIDEDAIARTGLNSINDVLQRLPSSGGGLSSKFNNSGNLGNPPDGGGVGAGAAEIDLRYLGSRRVLVLVDGLRYVNGASASGVPGSTDLNSIPESAIQRVEVLQDGASALYGSDAIAGVVNIITKRSQEGLMGLAQIGGYAEEGDGFTQNYQLSWGNRGDGPLQIVIGGNYVQQDPVFAGDRALSAWPEPYDNQCRGSCSGFVPNGRYAGTIFGNTGLGTTVIAPVIGRRPTPADYRTFVSPTDRFNFQPFNYLQVPLERYGAFGTLRYELSDTVNFTARGMWNRRESKNQAAPLPFGIGPSAGLTPVLNAIVVSASNPFNPFGVDLGGSNGNITSITRRFLEGGPRRFSQEVDTLYGVVTLDGRFGVGDNQWFWDINASYGRNKAEQTMLGNIDSSRLRQALGPLAGCTGSCVPFNLFGGFGTITPEMINFVTFEQNDSSEQTQFDITANVSGSLLTLPAGPVGLALGVEYRDLDGRFDPDPVVQAGFSSDIPALATSGGYNVKEAYAELNVPLLADTPFFDLLELNGAVRFSDYSTSGSATTFKGGVNWKPFADLRLRASYAEGFRAPSIGELFGTQSRFDEVIADPCSTTSTAALSFNNSATVRAACIADGVPAAGYAQPNQQISVTTGGNQALEPETSESYVLGGVYSPSWAPGLALEANYYNVKVNGAIQAIPRLTTVLNCLLTNDPATCALVTRVGGELTEIEGFLQNIAAINTDGIDVNLTYRGFDLGAGRLGFTWSNTFLLNYDVLVPGPSGTELFSREGVQVGSPAQGFPEWKSVGSINYDGPGFGATLTGRYISELTETNTPANVLKSVFYTDFQMRFLVGDDDQFGFALGVNNLFDVSTPGCVTCESNNFSQAIHDVPGRYWYVRANFRL